MTTRPLHSVSVAGIVLDESGRVLVIRRRDNGQWQPPGGVLELDETFEDGVVREVFEETGMHVAVERLTGVYKNMSQGVVALVYRCRPVGGEPRATEESAAVRWCAFEEIKAHMIPSFAIRIADAMRVDEQGPTSRAHDGVHLLDRGSDK